MRLLRPGWYWPIWRFWTFSPWGWIAALIWNFSEASGYPLPGPIAPWIFGMVMGVKGQRVDCQKDFRK